MLKKFNFKLIFLLLFSTCATAQTGFDQPAKSAPSTSMSASDFRNAVGDMSKQTTDSLNQQAKSLFPKTPSSPSNNPPSTPSNLPPPETPTTPVDNSFSVNSGAPATNPQPGRPQPSNQPADNYTGFGGGKSNTNTNTSAPPASSGNKGGWNINY